jgi:hypothetical protein
MAHYRAYLIGCDGHHIKAVDLNCFRTGCQRVGGIWTPKVENPMAGRPGTDIPTSLNADILALRLPIKKPADAGCVYFEMTLMNFDDRGPVNFLAIHRSLRPRTR